MTAQSKEIGKKIRQLRENQGLTQEQLALRMGISKDALHRLENCNDENMRLVMAANAAVKLGVGIDVLIGQAPAPAVTMKPAPLTALDVVDGLKKYSNSLPAYRKGWAAELMAKVEECSADMMLETWYMKCVAGFAGYVINKVKSDDALSEPIRQGIIKMMADYAPDYINNLKVATKQ